MGLYKPGKGFLSVLLAISFALSPLVGLAQEKNHFSLTLASGGFIGIDGATLQLIGTISTSSSDDQKIGTIDVETIGWFLIIIGSLVGPVKSASGAEIQYSSHEVFDSMVEQAEVTAENPKITSGSMISFAVQSFEHADQGVNYDQKAKDFSKIIIKLKKEADALAQKIITQTQMDALLRRILGRHDTQKNREMIRRSLALAGVEQEPF